jgi:DNA-binding transcriptional ArsR family regulator
MSAKKLTKAGLRRAVRAMALEIADAVVELVEEQGLWDESGPESEDDDLAAPRVRRSPVDLEQWMARILAELRRSDEPVAIGAIAARLGTSSRQLAHPMALLVDQGKVERSGERRGARYQLVRRQKRSPKRSTGRAVARRR